MSDTSKDTKSFKPDQAREIVDDKEAKLAVTVDVTPAPAVPQSCINTTVMKPEKLLKANIFSKLGFRPRGINSQDMKGKQEKDESQKKTGSSSKTQRGSESKSKSDKKKDRKDPKSGGGQKLK